MTDAIEEGKPTGLASNADALPTLRTDVNFSDDDLSEQAKQQFRSHIEALRAQQLNTRSMLANDRLSPVGRHLLCLTLEKDYTNYKNVLNYVAAHPDIRTTAQLKRDPLVLCGLPRTGTTLLYNLLACDPACRAPFFTDISEPIPPLTRSDTSGQMARNKVANSYTDMLKALGLSDNEREAKASHPSYSVEEDLFILQHAGVNLLNFLLPSDKDRELVAWWENFDNKDFAYEYHKAFIQMLNSVDAPQSHWLLKAPTHTIYLNSLLRYYPKASLIMIHRRLDEVIPSAIRLEFAFDAPYLASDKTDTNANRDAVVKNCLHRIDIFIRRLIEWRCANQDIPVLDLLYEDLVAQPIDTVRRVYKHFGLAWSEEFEVAMLDWLHNNPQGSQGRNAYTLKEFGLQRETIEKCYEKYYQMFLKARDQ